MDSTIHPPFHHALSLDERSALRSEAVAFVRDLLARESFETEVPGKRLSARCVLDELSERFERDGGRAALYQAFPEGPVSGSLLEIGVPEDSVSGLCDPAFGTRL